MKPENTKRDYATGNEAGRPDWDPYAVWRTHVMQAAEQDAAPALEADATPDSSWNPYSVWQALIKN